MNNHSVFNLRKSLNLKVVVWIPVWLSADERGTLPVINRNRFIALTGLCDNGIPWITMKTWSWADQSGFSPVNYSPGHHKTESGPHKVWYETDSGGSRVQLWTLTLVTLDVFDVNESKSILVAACFLLQQHAMPGFMQSVTSSTEKSG